MRSQGVNAITHYGVAFSERKTASAGIHCKHHAHTERRAAQMKVAIVEDEIRIREGIEKLLKKLNRQYEVVAVAENGEDGLNRIRETKPDIVITDICMPVMDGLEMLEKMTAEGLGAKTVVLSAYSDFEYARSAMKYGVTEYLLKPTSLMDFEQAMAHVEEQVMLDRSRKPAEIGSIDQVFRDLLLGRMKASPSWKDT